MWPRNEFGIRAALQLAVADAPWPRCPPPECTTICSIAAPSLEANHVRAPEQVDAALGERRRPSPAASGASPPSAARPSPRAGPSNGSSCIGAAPRRRSTGSTGDERDGLHRAGGRRPSRSRRRARRCARSRLRPAGRWRRTPSSRPRRTRMPTPVGGRAVDALHLLVADGEGLGLVGADPRVGVVGARLPGGLDGLLRDVERHPHLPRNAAGARRPGPNRGHGTRCRRRARHDRYHRPALRVGGPRPSSGGLARLGFGDVDLSGLRSGEPRGGTFCNACATRCKPG